MIKKDDWFITFKPKHTAAIRLFCFHYGGGGASIFRQWANDIIEFAEVVSIQLPGREERYNEPLLSDLHVIIDKLCINFTNYTNKPFIFFGHSLGALIAFELARALRKKGMFQPKKLIVSGTKAPQICSNEPFLHKLSDEKFLKELEKYNGIPHSIITDKELISMFLPAIRADFCISETYQYKIEPPLTYPIVALGGLDDNTFNKEWLIEWKEQTNDSFKYYFLPGNHFFIKDSYREIIDLMNSFLTKSII
jgi:medium-chain acyl-[acyl-carrier-protein] hydrolase